MWVDSDGVEGYVPRDLVVSNLPATPEEAVAITEQTRAARSVPTPITMYASDGVTVVGEAQQGAITAEEQP